MTESAANSFEGAAGGIRNGQQSSGLDRPAAPAGESPAHTAARSVLPAALVVLLVAGGGLAVWALRSTNRPRGSGSTAAASSASSSVPRSSTSGLTATQHLVLADGDTVRVNGAVLAVPGRPVRLCAPHPTAADGGPAQQFTDCRAAVTATGIDLSRLSSRQVSDGRIFGMADLTGTYRAGTVTVTRQRPFAQQPVTPRDRVPCPAPAGGWPRGPAEENLDLTPAEQYQNAHPGFVNMLALLRPSPNQVLAYILTDQDPVPVRSALAPVCGGRLCVTRSRYTRGQIAATISALEVQMAGDSLTTVTTVGEGLSDTGQPQVSVEVPAVSPAFAHLLDTQPADLVHLSVWIEPLP